MTDKRYMLTFFDAHPYDEHYFNKLNKDYKFKIRYVQNRLSISTVELAKDADAICVFVNDTVDRDVIDKLVEYDIKLIALRCAGFNNVDLKYAAGKVALSRVPAYSPYAVAEHAFGLILTLNRKIHRAYLRTRELNFSLNGLTGFDMHGKTIGVIGTGKIGRAMISIAKGCGMNVLAYDIYPDHEYAKKVGIRYAELADIYSDSDIISLHCPLISSTYHMIEADQLATMKDGVYIINTSRGALINTKDLVDAILNGKVGAAGLDVYEEEDGYFFEDHSQENVMQDEVLARLLGMHNVIVTSHQAFLTDEALTNIATTTLENIKSYLVDNRLLNPVEA